MTEANVDQYELLLVYWNPSSDGGLEIQVILTADLTTISDSLDETIRSLNGLPSLQQNTLILFTGTVAIKYEFFHSLRIEKVGTQEAETRMEKAVDFGRWPAGDKPTQQPGKIGDVPTNFDSKFTTTTGGGSKVTYPPDFVPV